MNFKTLVLSSVVGITSILGGVGINEAQARPHRLVHFETDRGTDVYFEPKGRHGVEVLVNNSYNRTGFEAVRNCYTGEYSWKNNDGYTQAQIDSITLDACQF